MTAGAAQARSRSGGGSAPRSGASAGRSGAPRKRDAEALSAPSRLANPSLGARLGSGSGSPRASGDAPLAKRLATGSTLGRPGGSISPVTYPQWPSLDDHGGGGSAGGSAPVQRSSGGGSGSGGPGASGAAASVAIGADTGGGPAGAAGEAAGEAAGKAAGGAAHQQGKDPVPSATEASGEGPSGAGAAEDVAPYVQESEVAFMRALMARLTSFLLLFLQCLWQPSSFKRCCDHAWHAHVHTEQNLQSLPCQLPLPAHVNVHCSICVMWHVASIILTWFVTETM